MKDLYHRDYWIADTGATTHLTFDSHGMVNSKEQKDLKVVMGNGTEAVSTIVGNIPGLIVKKDGKKAHKAILQSVAYADAAKCNLFSLTYMMKKGWKMSGDDNGITITKDKVSL